MKKLFLLMVFALLFLSLQAQPVAKIVLNRWAGGICCSSGVEYGVSLELPKEGFTCFDSLEIDFEGIKYSFSDDQLTRYNRTDSIPYYLVGFGYRDSNTRYDSQKSDSQYYGISNEQISVIEQAPLQFILIRNGKREFIEHVKLEETITAYP
ncbi:MAG: hypothetical protein HYZ43_08165 [Flavobacteriia bacterium]|nr:hypothetical protein [Flavobacteriia bacterium]